MTRGLPPYDQCRSFEQRIAVAVILEAVRESARSEAARAWLTIPNYGREFWFAAAGIAPSRADIRRGIMRVWRRRQRRKRMQLGGA